jgi:prepilin-type processing-associated H-X9-DG protein
LNRKTGGYTGSSGKLDKGRPVVTPFSLFQTVQTPNDKQFQFGSCTFGCAGCGLDQAWSVDASSGHAGGVNVLMSDGSVRFVKDTINRTTWWALGTKDNGEVVSSDAY